MKHEFEITGPITIAAKLRSSDLTVTTSESAAQVVVDVQPRRGADELAAATKVEMRDGRLIIEVPKSVGLLGRSGSVAIEVQAPLGTSLDVEAGSGDVRTHGPLARVEIRSGSGDVTIERAEQATLTGGSGDVVVDDVDLLKITAGSGDIRIGRSAASAELRTGSGDVAIRDAADVSLVTGSGDAVIGSLDGAASLSAGSGDILVRNVQQGEVQARTASGDVIVGVAAGTAALLDCSSVTGRVSSDLQAGDAPAETERGVVLRLRAVSGDVRVQRA